MKTTLPRVPETVVQQHIVQLLRSIGGVVYTLGTRRRRGDYQGTCQSPGLADLLAFLPIHPVPPPPALLSRLVAIECKALGGRLRPEQEVFRGHCRLSGVDHIVGDLDAVIAWLMARGYLHRERVPHYR